ncbi:hypothetical protein NFI96_034673 [Prochilodus magdalenae]|nr:hypothetical protein NFI96_034673 [Prochilodus magdalenae]
MAYSILRRCQVAVESDRRRLLRRCLNDWRLWCRMEKERRELLSQQEETRLKMAALISAAASGKLTAENCSEQPPTDTPNTGTKLEDSTQHIQVPVQRVTSASTSPTVTDRKVAPPTQAWQVTRRHAGLSPIELHQAQLRSLSSAPRSRSAEVIGGRFEHRHATQQQTIAEQRRLLREQQELISCLQERHTFLELRQEAERTAESAATTRTVQPKNSATHSITQASTGGGDAETRSNRASRENHASHPTPKGTASRQVASHPAVREPVLLKCLDPTVLRSSILYYPCTTTQPDTLPLCLPAMEERARLRAKRRREVEEVKKRREEEKLAQMKAAEEERLRQEEEEKRIAAERRKEEKRQQREVCACACRELEKQRRMEQEQKLLKQAQEHYHRSLLLHKGLMPWKRLLERSDTNMEFKDLQCISEARAERFYRAQTLRKVFVVLLDHATHQRLLAWDKERQAEEHNARRSVQRCFSGWRRLPAALKDEREREVRREHLRRKVAEILPDFRLSPVSGVWSPAQPL